MSRKTSSRSALTVALLAIAAMLMVTGTAGAKTHTFSSKKERGGKVVFKIKRLSGQKVRSADAKNGRPVQAAVRCVPWRRRFS